MTVYEALQLIETARAALVLAVNPMAGLLWITWRVLAESVDQIAGLMVL